MSLNTTMVLSLLADSQKTDGGAVYAPRPLITLRKALLNGVGAGKANVVYGPKRRTLASGTAEELDLSGSLTDPHGDPAVFARVHLLYIYNTKKETDVGANLELGGVVGTVENWKLFKSTDDIYILGPGGMFLIFEPSAAGKVVTATTEDLLRIANVSSPAASISYDILVVGASS